MTAMAGPDQVIYTLRHAAFEFGRQHIIAGRLDPPLNRQGLQQIEEMVAARVPLEYDLVISSPQQRALETAKRVTGLAETELVTSYLCMERNYGRLEGVPRDQLDRIRPATYYVSAGNVNHSLNPPEGETLEQLRERVVTFHDFVQGLARKNLLIVGHGTFLQQYHGYLRGQDVYNALETSVACLELNAFGLRDSRLVSDQCLYRPEMIEEPW